MFGRELTILHFLSFAAVIACFAFIIVAPLLLYRLAWKKAQPKLWTKRYFRLAVDTSMITTACLLLASMTWESRDTRFMFNTIARRANVAHFYQDDAYQLLQRLTQLSYFADHLIPFVILPTLIVGFVGYSIERHRDARQEANDAE